MYYDLNCDVKFIKGVGEKRARLLNKLGISSVGSLLRYYPHRYENFRDTVPVFSDNIGKTVCVKARVATAVYERRVRNNMVIYTLAADDESGRMNITYFNASYTAKSLKVGEEYLFYGKMEGTPFLREMHSPKVLNVCDGGLKPVYFVTKGLNSKFMARIIKTAFENAVISDSIPTSVRSAEDLCDIKTALYNIHFPKTEDDLNIAKKRLIFEELFLLQAGLRLLKTRKKRESGSNIENYCDEFFASLPFSPTNAQRKAAEECLSDMSSGYKMNRLIQGDVGSGKTLVSAAVIYSAVKSGYQCALMAPTEILAEQHFKTLSDFFEPFGITLCLLTGSVTAAKKREIREKLVNGEVQVAVGTHALFSDGVEFKNLALVVTDEQHRFGVAQRAALSGKGDSPHVMVMSATPIPRTLAMTIYGDMDISIINEYPKGRQPIETYAVGDELHERLYKFVDKHIDEGRQVYIICPLVEPSDLDDGEESTEIYDEKMPACAVNTYENLASGRFKNRRVGLLHGKMKPQEKYNVMRAFSSGDIQILVATTVVEVGIDVPNAALMIIENAERFGLSQLHQLRGRIGRGAFKSTCVLVSDSSSCNTKQRLDILCRTRDGFEIADEDLKLRGPGDFLGKRQHGLPELKIADMAEDIEVLRRSGVAAAEVIAADPDLSSAQNKGMKSAVIGLFATADA